MADNLAVFDRPTRGRIAVSAGARPASWTTAYLRRAAVVDCGCALAAGLLAFDVRFGAGSRGDAAYFFLSICLPVLWLAALGAVWGV